MLNVLHQLSPLVLESIEFPILVGNPYICREEFQCNRYCAVQQESLVRVIVLR